MRTSTIVLSSLTRLVITHVLPTCQMIIARLLTLVIIKSVMKCPMACKLKWGQADCLLVSKISIKKQTESIVFWGSSLSLIKCQSSLLYIRQWMDVPALANACSGLQSSIDGDSHEVWQKIPSCKQRIASKIMLDATSALEHSCMFSIKQQVVPVILQHIQRLPWAARSKALAGPSHQV